MVTDHKFSNSDVVDEVLRSDVMFDNEVFTSDVVPDSNQTLNIDCAFLKHAVKVDKSSSFQNGGHIFSFISWFHYQH